jgi:hypothetical protein
MEQFSRNDLVEMQALRGNPIIVYAGMIQDDAVPILYECLRILKPVDVLDVVLSTGGGVVNTARRIALLLHDYTQHLNILIPYRARSAGTLLSLSANQLILGPLAELSPIDGQIGAIGDIPVESPTFISAEDIRAFRRMAEEWFGIQREEDRLQVFALLSQRIFPTTLSSFYRADQLIRRMAEELLCYQLPNIAANERLQIVKQLVSGYSSHDYGITRVEARQLGLRVDFASPEEEVLMWRIQEAYRQCLSGYEDQKVQIAGLIASTNFTAYQVNRQIDGPEDNTQTQSRLPIGPRWEIL